MSVAYQYYPRYTLADYQRWEGDWELIDGMAIDMGPSPFGPHGAMLAELTYSFKAALKRSTNCLLEVLVEIDWIVDQNTVVRPDLCIIEGSIPVEHLRERPVLITEIISNSTAIKDRTAKFELYQCQGVPYYLIADPHDQQLQIFRLADGQYQPQNATSPFLFELNQRCSLEVDLGG